MKITFLPKGLTVIYDESNTVLELASEAGIDIDGNCAGEGTCGKCKVRVLSGNDFHLDKAEEKKLSEDQIKDGYRLACRFKPQEDVVVEVPLVEGAAKRKTKLVVMPDDFVVNNKFRKKLVHIKASTLANQKSDILKIKEACHIDGDIKIKANTIRKIPGILSKGREITITFREDEIMDIEAGDTSKACYGVAFDIGTTTVVGILWDLITGESVGIKAMTNPQGVYGADVISRITYATDSPENLENIKNKVVSCLNEITEDFSKKFDINVQNIYDIVVVGNTTMSHLLLGVDPHQLAIAPFTPVFVNGVSDMASSFRLIGNENARVYLLPNIAGHVGSDITAGILSTEIMEKEGVHLLLDVGTNGEIVLKGKDAILTCSTAAGPAFEGASIFQGMRAAAGAIERVQIDETVNLHVIGNETPRGMCGSGIIDAVAQMISNGLVDKTGRFTKDSVLVENKVSEDIRSRFRDSDKGKQFVLYQNPNGEDVVLLQKDIREVQLAKAALHAGIRIMMNQLGITDKDITNIHIAGAFGNYIDIDSAVTIGLLPDIEKDKILSVGNAAGIGACMALLCDDKRAEAERVTESIIHIELAACDDFQDEYIRAMKF